MHLRNGVVNRVWMMNLIDEKLKKDKEKKRNLMQN